jgi:diaminohydroxyphosphoribosylaminopyrimidine deaminase / 5-amino-6-(5-phosphoribosylamino)uracil reductase
MASEAEQRAMRQALELASGSPRTHPNPRVAAVLLSSDGRVLGAGVHTGVGQPHAEVEALRETGSAAAGATMVVTLEPCNHTGRTGPCSEALLAAGVARVVYAQTDPHALASGGASRLRDAGVSVEGGLLSEEAKALNVWWSLAMERHRPFVTWKMATTVDGRVAASDGTSRWITGAAARAEVHRLRAEVDAVLVGTGTVLADDPQLTARRPDGTQGERQPIRVVVGRRPVPPSARILDSSAPSLVVASHDVGEMLGVLLDHDVHTALLEGGPQLAAAFVAADAVDRIIGYQAPLLLGAGLAAVGSLGADTIADARRFRFADVARVGDDLRWTADLHETSGVPLPTVLSDQTGGES